MDERVELALLPTRAQLIADSTPKRGGLESVARNQINTCWRERNTFGRLYRSSQFVQKRSTVWVMFNWEVFGCALEDDVLCE
jgi:hypothetical protein